MGYKTELQSNNTDLQEILDAVNTLPEGITLPTLTNPATIDKIISGYEAMDGDGNVIIGTQPEYTYKIIDVSNITSYQYGITLGTEVDDDPPNPLGACVITTSNVPIAAPFNKTFYIGSSWTVELTTQSFNVNNMYYYQLIANLKSGNSNYQIKDYFKKIIFVYPPANIPTTWL